MIEDILIQHFEKYPKMQAQDAVKLIYQQEFGPEHMIKDPAKALAMIRQEMNGLDPKAGEPLYESIGNGLCRLNLRPCKERGIPAEDIARLFTETAAGVQGEKKQFRLALRVLQRLAEEDETPFDPVELDIFLAHYPASCPALHHSEAYRAAYAPTYRIVLQKKVKDYLAARRQADQQE